MHARLLGSLEYFSYGVCIKEIGTLKNDKKENTWIRLELKHFFFSPKYVATVKQFGPKNYIQLQTNILQVTWVLSKPVKTLRTFNDHVQTYLIKAIRLENIDEYFYQR